MNGKSRSATLLVTVLSAGALLIASLSNQSTSLAAAKAAATAAATTSATVVATMLPTGAVPPNGAPGTPPDGAPPSGSPGDGSGTSTTNPVLTATCGALTLDAKTGSTSGQAYASTQADESAICVINAGALTLTDSKITKSGDTSSADKSSFYGLNAAVLAGSGSTVTLTGGTVTANGGGTNGVFSTGSGTTVTLSNVSIEANGDGAHAVMATLGGKMVLTGVNMLTTGVHSGAIATDRGSGTIIVTGGKVTTSGADSPGIYSTGAITVSDATITATGAESAVIEGANSITLNNTSLTSSLDNKWGVMIYQSFSGDAEGSQGTFTMTGGTLANTAANGPLFYVTNSTGVITLKGVAVTAKSGTLMQAAANDRWGTSGSNGGTIVFTAEGQSLAGNIVADKISSITLTLNAKSSLTGSINADKAAKSIGLTLDATSTWEVTADSYLTSLSDAAGISGTSITNVTGNGHNVYYNASDAVNSQLGGKTYSLVNGGQLIPM